MGTTIFFLFSGLILVFAAFGGSINLPTPYRELIEQTLPSGVSVEISNLGGNFKATVRQNTPEGMLITNISSDDFISFYAELYWSFVGKQPPEVSIKIKTPSGVVPYNPFYEIWDPVNNVKLLRFSRLKPGCKPPVIELRSKGIAGIKILVGFNEVKRKLFEGGFKKPSYYCY